jgi:subtilisin family serine protease
MKKIVVFTSLVVMLVMASAAPVAAKPEKEPQVLDPSALFVPDITDVQFESALSTDVVTASALPEVTPFWVDLVNKENVENDGDGVYVAVLDTGLLPQWPFFLSQANIATNLGKGFTHEVSWNEDLQDLVFGPLIESDDFITDLASGHGTHVTSTIVGFNVNNSFWVEGVAPEVTIIPVLVLDAWLVDSPYGELEISGGTDEMISAGIYYVADLAETLDGPVVINMSLGGPEPSPMIEEAIDYATNKGVIVVASAGNNGEEGMGYPGGLEQVISAGAAGWADMFIYGEFADVPEKLNSKDTMGNNWQIYLEDFSSRPNKDLDQKHQDLDVTAPGAWVVGPFKDDFVDNTGYYYLSGTSMAAPHVSALAALLLEDHPELNQAEVERLLSLAAAGLPLPASDAFVAFPYVPAGYYWCPWDGGDYGSGFLLADQIFKVAKSKIK